MNTVNGNNTIGGKRSGRKVIAALVGLVVGALVGIVVFDNGPGPTTVEVIAGIVGAVLGAIAGWGIAAAAGAPRADQRRD